LRQGLGLARIGAVKSAARPKKPSRKPATSSGERPKPAPRAKAKTAKTAKKATKAARPVSPPRKATPAPDAIDPAFRPVAEAFADSPGVALGKMFSSKAVLNVGGKMFAMFVKGRFVVKLPRERVADLVDSGVGTYFDPGHGRLMKEWVAVADPGARWIDLAREAHAFVKSKGP
jgi:hypothetical protein